MVSIPYAVAVAGVAVAVAGVGVAVAGVGGVYRSLIFDIPHGEGCLDR